MACKVLSASDGSLRPMGLLLRCTARVLRCAAVLPAQAGQLARSLELELVIHLQQQHNNSCSAHLPMEAA